MKTYTIAMALLVVAMTALPSLAETTITNDQPLTRTLSENEIRIEAKMKLDYKKGLIDSYQLTNFNRDLDGILVQEDSLIDRGLTADGWATIKKALCAFEARLDKSAGAATTAQVKGAIGETADANNAGLSEMEPTR
jgi:hypothetical protein